MKTEEKVAKEAAELDIQRVLARLDIELGDLKEVDDVKSLQSLSRAIQKGRLVVDDDERFVLALTDGTSLLFKHPDGSTFMALDRKDGGVAKLVAVMCSVTGKDGKFFSKLPSPDFNICRAIANLFLS